MAADDEEFRKAQAVGKERSTSTDVFRLVPHFTWRGITYPVAGRSVSFRHEQVEHKLQYAAGDFPEPLGPHSYLFRYTIPMRQDIAKGPYSDLFNTGLPRLVRDIRDRTPGTLNDPFYGEFQCVPMSFEETVDINKRDGTDVQVEFLHAPNFGDEEPPLRDNITGIEGLTSNAGALEAELTVADWNQEPSPKGVTDVLSAINGVGQRGLRQVDRASARLDDLAFRLRKIDETTSQAENPQNWRLRDSVRNALDATIRLRDHAAEDFSKKYQLIRTRYDKTVSVAASDNGMSVQELVEANPQLARNRGPLVPAGTTLKVRKRGKP